MSNKMAGIIVAVATLLLALVISLFSRIQITKKEKPVASSKPQQVVTATEKPSTKATGSEAHATDSVAFTPSPAPVKADTNSTTQKPVSNNGWDVINESELDYSADEKTVTGIVSGKTVYMDENNQAIYSVKIKVSIASVEQELNYYCMYASYKSLNIDDVVTVTYQQLGNDSICSLVGIKK